MTSVTINSLQAKKASGEKFTCIAAYDATFAASISKAGVDIILVGDSLGMVLQGHDSTLPVTVADMAYHTACVSRGNQGALVLADMPFMAYSDAALALESAAQLMRAGGQMVKLEGGSWLAGTIAQLVERGIPVCAHLGLTPQSVNTLGGYRVQGRQPEQAEQIIADSLAVEAAGASLLVLECVPSQLGKTISEKLRIPTIGIGAGPDTDAQVLVLHDMLGLNPRPAKFMKDFMAGSASIEAALTAFITDVRNGSFPAPEHCFE